jgi:CheY-like chemotaxis protein/DNA-binding Lrp family transcriptional regulator
MEPVEDKLLIVDDDAELRRTLNVTLHQRGFEADLVDEGLSALDLIEKSVARGHPYRCVVADLKLPDIDGLKLVEVIKAKYPGMPVIAISGYGSPDTEEAVQARKGDGFLPKPFLVDDLTAAVRSVPQLEVRDVPRPRAHVVERSVSGYSLVTIDPGADALAVFRALYFMNNVVYCDAVLGNADAVMLLNAPNASELERAWRDGVMKVPGVKAATFNPVVKAELDSSVARFIDEYEQQRGFDPLKRKRAWGPNALSTYLLIDVERGHLPSVYARLCLDDAVLFCDAVADGYDLIALVQTTSPADYQRLLSEDLKRIDGIVRTMSLRVVNILEP